MLYTFCCVYTNVTLAQVVVQHTDGIGVVMYNTVGENAITYSKFLNNKRNVNIEVSNTFNGGGGLYIEFAFCYPGIPSCFNGTSNIPEKYTSGSNYVISETHFTQTLQMYLTLLNTVRSFCLKDPTTWCLVEEGDYLCSLKEILLTIL